LSTGCQRGFPKQRNARAKKPKTNHNNKTKQNHKTKKHKQKQPKTATKQNMKTKITNTRAAFSQRHTARTSCSPASISWKKAGRRPSLRRADRIDAATHIEA